MTKTVKSRDPILCYVCHKKFTQARNLRRHFKGKHDGYIKVRQEKGLYTVEKVLEDILKEHTEKEHSVPERYAEILKKYDIRTYLQKPVSSKSKTVKELQQQPFDYEVEFLSSEPTTSSTSETLKPSSSEQAGNTAAAVILETSRSSCIKNKIGKLSFIPSDHDNVEIVNVDNADVIYADDVNVDLNGNNKIVGPAPESISSGLNLDINNAANASKEVNDDNLDSSIVSDSQATALQQHEDSNEHAISVSVCQN